MSVQQRAMTPQERVARGEAPVKEEFIRKVARVKVDAVAGSLGAGPAAGGGEPPATKKKSRNQLKKERVQQRRADLCHMLVQGTCKFGEKCKFNHDLVAYLDAKPPDLPGSCPFDATGTCLYGITCRWASKHRHVDALSQQAQQAKQAQQAQQAAAAAAAAAAEGAGSALLAVDAPGPSAGEPAQGGLAPAVQQNGAAEPAKQQSAAAEGQQPGGPQQGQPEQPPAGELQQGEPPAGEPEGRDWWWRRDGTIPARVVGPLVPEGEPMLEPLNMISKSLQSVLRREEYDFSRTDEVLALLGIPNTRKQRQEQRQQRREQAQQGAQPQPGAVAEAAAGAGAAEEGAAAAEEAAAAAPPSPKRPRLDPAAQAECAAAASGGAAAAPAATGSDAAFLSGLGIGAEPPASAPGQQAAATPNGAGAPTSASAAVEAANGLPAAAGAEGGDYIEARVHPREKRGIDFRDKLYLAPLTTVGNLPFRRLCKGLGADITCGEMALATNLLQGQASEWALLKRHPSEDCFGVQVCGGFPDSMARCAQLIEDQCEVDFVDINFGCPIDVVCSKGGGSACLLKPARMEHIVRSMSSLLSCPLTFKCRKGYFDDQPVAHTIIPKAASWGAAAVTLHGRTREQRYSKLADWDYIHKCAELAPPELQLVGNGDCFSYEDYYRCLEGGPGGRKLAGMYIARGALVKPWIFTEIKERQHWDISAGERFDMLRRFCGMGLEAWGSDGRGVETTRRFLLEWLSFTHRYIPVGLLEVLPQQLHWRPPAFVGRSDLETLLASDNAADWVKISEMLLGPAPPGFVFSPKHKANAYAKREGADVAIAMDEY